MGIETLAASTLFKVGTGIATGASILSGVAGLAQSQSEARRLRQQADAQDQATAANEQRLRRTNRMAMGANRARLAASGLTLDGSAMDALADDAVERELNTLLTRYEGTARSRALRDQARSTRAAGFIGLGGSLLNAGASYLGGASAYQRLFGAGSFGGAAAGLGGGPGGSMSGLSSAASSFAQGSAFVL